MAKAFLAAILVLGAISAYILTKTGIFEDIGEIHPATCTANHSIPAAEDIIIDHASEAAYLTSYQPDTAGIYRLDLNNPLEAPERMDLAHPAEFRPLGIAGWPAEGPFKTLFVINRAAEPSVLRFDVATGALEHTLTDPLIRYPNNLVAVGPEEIYLTNTHVSKPGTFARLLETVLRLERGDVVRAHGGEVQVVAGGIGYANGIAASGDQVWVGSIATHHIHQFARAADGTLRRTGRVNTPGGVDNLTVAADGSLWAALHPKAFDALAHLSGDAPVAPSRAVRVNGNDVEVVFEDPGEAIAAAATAAPWRDVLLIGPVKDDHFLVCRGLRR